MRKRKLFKLNKTEKAILYLAWCLESGEWQGVERETLRLLQLESIKRK